MEGPPRSFPYNHGLKPLEKLLGGVRRPGNFFVQGAVDTPMPRVEIEGAGVLSFPVPTAQAGEVVRQAVRAPYGRGGETLLDESVRKVWQLPPDKVRIGGKAWAQSFQQILAAVRAGLGCADTAVTAEFYKLLVYEEGGFFKAHRDTEKAGGMFGTLVVVLPAAHHGGELVVRHAGREVVCDLATDEVSEVKYAAFYADCEHEVRPIRSGHRVCLIYNLLHPPAAAGGETPVAPLYDDEIATAATILGDSFRAAGAPAKLAWLLAHQYSPAGLGFAGLKGADAALVQVLRQAAEQAGCAVHLGVVHIEESGPAEPDYSAYQGRGPRRRYHEFGEEEVEEDVDSDDFTVIEVSNASWVIDSWVDGQDRPAEFGRVPLAEGELLPAGALDAEAPDEQRLLEATGNEGASFERAYHRAALVLWPRERSVIVLLQAGVGAALPVLEKCVRALDRAADPAATRAAALATARQILDTWEAAPEQWAYRLPAKEPDRGAMAALLGRLGDGDLLERFVRGVVAELYDGGENEALATHLPMLGATRAGGVLAGLVREVVVRLPGACTDLLGRALRELDGRRTTEWDAALQPVAAAIVEALPRLGVDDGQEDSTGWRQHKTKPADAALVSGLLVSLSALGAAELRMAAAAAIAANPVGFDPVEVVVPALETLRAGRREGLATDPDAARLWLHAAEFLLGRSEHPPALPTDWRQAVKISCQCEDCRALQAFALDPAAKVHRFRVRMDRRRHLHEQIKLHGLDLTDETERRGSPQTLVCTKTRATYRRACARHRADCAAMRSLLAVGRREAGKDDALAARLAAASERQPEPCTE